MEPASATQDALYEQTAQSYGPALERLAKAYELDAEARRDLLQEIHFQIWRSFARFDQRCSLRTWVYRIAHNVATAHVIRQQRVRQRLVDLDEIEASEALEDKRHSEQAVSQKQALERLSTLIQSLKPLDRQIIVSYLEGMTASAISEITGLSPANVAMKVHRITKLLKRWFGEGGVHEQ